MPMFRHLSLSPAMACAVRATMVTAGLSDPECGSLICLVASMPSMTGICTSMRMRSYRFSLVACRAWAPSLAVSAA